MPLKSHVLSPSYPVIALLITLSAHAAGAEKEEVSQSVVLTSDQLQAMEVERGQGHRPQILPLEDGLREVSIVIDGREEKLILHPHSLRSERFGVHIAGANGQLQALDQVPPPATYRGHIHGAEGSQVAASILDGSIRAMIMLSDTTYIVEPLPEDLISEQRGQHVTYALEDLLDVEGECGNRHVERKQIGRTNNLDRAAMQPHAEAMPQRPTFEMAGTSSSDREFIYTGFEAFAITVAFDADFPYFQSNSHSVNDTIADIETIMNVVALIYRRDTFIRHDIGDIVIRTSQAADPYSTTDSEALLGQFRDHWNDNHDNINRAVAHLMTGRNIDGTTIGRAYLGRVCHDPTFGSSDAYGFSQVTFSSSLNRKVSLVAHELGHNWDAVHCNQTDPPALPCNIMCSSLNGCSGIGSPNFAWQAIGVITDFADGESCVAVNSVVRWVDFDYGGWFPNGSFGRPYPSMSDAVSSVPSGGVIIIKGSNTDAGASINKPMSIHTWQFRSRIGQ